jgi:integrase
LTPAFDVKRPSHTLTFRTGLTWMADAGVPIHVLRKIAGHGSLTTTQRYLHPEARSIAAAGDALSADLIAKRSPGGPQLRVV